MDFLPSTSRSSLLSVFVHSVYFYFSLDPLRCANEENGCRSAYSLMNVNAPLIHLTYTVHSLRIAYNSKQNLKCKSMELLKSFRILMTQKRTFFPAIFSRCQLKNETKNNNIYFIWAHQFIQCNCDEWMMRYETIDGWTSVERKTWPHAVTVLCAVCMHIQHVRVFLNESDSSKQNRISYFDISTHFWAV